LISRHVKNVSIQRTLPNETNLLHQPIKALKVLRAELTYQTQCESLEKKNKKMGGWK
jgi:hypothetical protein